MVPATAATRLLQQAATAESFIWRASIVEEFFL
jgi:hypothetical protein